MTIPKGRRLEIIGLREKGLNETAIAGLYGVTRQRIRQIAGNRGNRRYVPHEPEFKATVRKLWDEGPSTAEIGRRLGVTKNVIVGLAHRNDFPPRQSPIRRHARRILESNQQDSSR